MLEIKAIRVLGGHPSQNRHHEILSHLPIFRANIDGKCTSDNFISQTLQRLIFILIVKSAKILRTNIHDEFYAIKQGSARYITRIDFLNYHSRGIIDAALRTNHIKGDAETFLILNDFGEVSTTDIALIEILIQILIKLRHIDFKILNFFQTIIGKILVFKDTFVKFFVIDHF